VRIGLLAAAAGVTEKTIRYYEDIGVLEPPSRSANGYRDYERSALDKLRFVKAAQSVGLTLGEIREVIALRDRGETPCEHVVSLIHRRSEEIDHKIGELEHLRAELTRLERRARSLDPEACAPTRSVT
jgi:DNA-binding transcriptional MerR regulator